MKKLLFFLLSVVLIGSVGCGSNKDLSTEVTNTESTEVVNETVEPTTEAVTVETEDAGTAQQESTEAVTEVDSSADTKDTGKDNQSDNIASEEKTADNKQSEENKSSDSQESGKQPKDTKSEPASEQQPKPEENSKPEEKPEEKPEPKPEPQAVSYSPEKVVSLAISKCQAGGMVTTEQHLKDNLNAGKITKEEYDEYYPLDGLEDSYYSVFVNVDLNKAIHTHCSGVAAPLIVGYIAKKIFKKPLVYTVHCCRVSTYHPMSKFDSLINTAIMLHTSGTTSNPKRVMLTHKNLICNIESNIASLEFNEKDTTLIVLPMYFGYCNCSQFLTHVYLGGRIIIAPQPFNPAIFLQLIEKYKCTNTTCIPSMLFLTISIRNKYDMSSLRYLCFGGGVMPVHKLKQIISFFEGTGIVQTYGQTEASPRVTCLLPKDCLRKIGSVGKPIPGVEIDILDKNGVPVKNGEKGEIVVRGNNVMKGYYKHQDKTEQTIINGWLHTGDIGRVDEEGYLYIVGRIKNVIISGGLNIYPEEIEEILINYEGIKEVIVFGEKHDILGEIPVAKVVTDGCYIDEGQILEYSKKMVDAYKIPKKIIFCEQLEKTYNGKIRRTV